MMGVCQTHLSQNNFFLNEIKVSFSGDNFDLQSRLKCFDLCWNYLYIFISRQKRRINLTVKELLEIKKNKKEIIIIIMMIIQLKVFNDLGFSQQNQ